MVNGLPLSGFMCPECYVFSTNANEISHHDGTCSNCTQCFMLPVAVIPIGYGVNELKRRLSKIINMNRPWFAPEILEDDISDEEINMLLEGKYK